MMGEPRLFGLQGEEMAANFLAGRGYRILERNFRTHRGEIDVIAYDGDSLVFVEVKARRSNAFGGAPWSVDRRKQVQLRKAAQQYLSRHQLRNQVCRFDLVFILADQGEEPVIELLQNAFEVEGGAA